MAPFLMTFNELYSNPVFKVTLFFDAEYLTNGYRYTHTVTTEGE